MDSHVRPGAIDLTEMLSDIEVPSLEVPELDVLSTASKSADLFADKKRAAWKEIQQDDARCDFAPNKVRVSFRFPDFGIVSLWKKSVYGPTLAEIKADENMIEKFAVAMSGLIQQLLGHCLSSGDWCLVTSPKRRHKERNFATLISVRLAALLNIPFYEDLAQCESRHRVGATFSLSGTPPKERNIIIFDDFVTSGATMQSMKNLLAPLGYNLVFFTAINNKS